MSTGRKWMLRDPVSSIHEISSPRRRPIACLIDAGWISLLFGWIYVAAFAAFNPEKLSEFIVGFIPIRRDTFGVVCFSASAVLFVLSAVWHGRTYPLVRAGRFFGGAAMVYLLVNTVSHPETLGMPLTHFAPWPTELVTLIIASAGFVTSHLRLTRNTKC
jgi:hypothetical protein